MVQELHGEVFASEQLEPGAQMDACPQMFIVALNMVAKKRKTTQCPATDEWKNEMGSSLTRKLYPALKGSGVLEHSTTNEQMKTTLSE